MNDQSPSSDETQHASSRLARLGSISLIVGVVIAGLAFVSDVTGLPFAMPRSWYVNKPVWYVLALAAFVSGCYLLWNPARASEQGEIRRLGARFDRVVLYTRRGCHLCDQAKDTLLKYKDHLPKIEEIDIQDIPQLVEQFETCIPVVEIDGKIRFRGEVNEILLRRMIQATNAPQ